MTSIRKGPWVPQDNQLRRSPETRAQDPESRYRTIYQEHLAAISAYALRRTSTPEDAADLVAETFLVAWRRLADVPGGSETRLWLYGVAKRVLANKRRGEARQGRLSSRLAQELRFITDAPPSSVAEPLEGLAEAFSALSKDDQDLLGMAVWEELDAASIGTVLGCSANAVRIRTHRARRRLESELRRQGLVKDKSEPGHEPDVGTVTRRI